jgi:hypothetical protein
MGIERESNEGRGRPSARGGVPTVRIPEAWEACFAGARIGMAEKGSDVTCRRAADNIPAVGIPGARGCVEYIPRARIGGHATSSVFGSQKTVILFQIPKGLGSGDGWQLTELPHTSATVLQRRPRSIVRILQEVQANYADIRCTQSFKDR